MRSTGLTGLLPLLLCLTAPPTLAQTGLFELLDLRRIDRSELAEELIETDPPLVHDIEILFEPDFAPPAPDASLDTVVATAPLYGGSATAVASETPSNSTTGATPSPTPTTEAVGSATAATGPRLVSSGGFQGADSFHFAEGDALIVETAPDQFVLRFENFSIRNGPDLYVYLSADPQQPSQDAIRLGGLKATDGAFNYEIPAGTDISALTHAMVWCDRFAVLFANASLVP